MDDDAQLLAPLILSDEDRGLQMSIADDGNAAYALMTDTESQQVLSGVWLYNHSTADTSVRWAECASEPLARNPQEYVVDEPFTPIGSSEEVVISFGGGTGLEAYAEIHIRSKFHAYMEARARIGWCVLAKKSSKVAKSMVVTPCADGSVDVHLCDYKEE
jgi:hypothetical protein